MKKKHFLLAIAFLLNHVLMGQTPIYTQDFEKILNSNNYSSIYYIDSYLPKKKYPVSLYTDKQGNDNYISPCCSDGNNGQNGYFTDLILFDKSITYDRHFLVVELKEMSKEKNYNLSMDVKYHPFTSYTIDSIQTLLLKDDKSLEAWRRNGSFEGSFLNFSLSNVNNKAWKKIEANINSKNGYKFIIIGNFRDDLQTKRLENNACSCISRKPDGRWDYCDIFIDNIKIVIN